MKAIFLLFALAACGAQPAPQMFGAVRSEVARDGRNYVVFQHQQIRADMIALIPQVTGCRLVPSTLQGDSGEMRGRLVCPR